jgi:hypothetical protein
MYELLGIEPVKGRRWILDVDYLSKRGPALGMDYDARGFGLFDIPGIYSTEVRSWVISDKGEDILGGDRDFDPRKNVRGRFLARHRQELGETFTFLGQVSYLSDRNFLEQFFKREFDEDLNQETYLYLKQQQDEWAWSILAQPNIRSWVNETAWLPRADGYLLGASFWDQFTYYTHASAGYAQFHRSSDIPSTYQFTPIPNEFDRFRPLPPSTDVPHQGDLDLGRFDWRNRLEMPLDLGPINLVPYGIVQLTHYTETLADEDGDTRIYGGFGALASLPFTRIYEDVNSQLFNLNGIAHKIVFDADYRYVQSNVDFRELPELDRINDDATDQAIRDLRQFRLETTQVTNPTSAQLQERFLATSPIYDPQLYALRAGVETSPEVLDDLQVLRFGMRQRWQTKRGFPGRQHIIDWMTLDVEASFFPQEDRDNFGHAFGLLNYDYTWHVGDRTTLVSSGWIDPFDDGARVFNVGMFLDRPDRLMLYLGYRMIDPIGSDTLIASTSYLFSPKWSATFTSSYDFSISGNLGTSLLLTRIGSDLQVSIGFNYNALTDNFGFAFSIVPTLAPQLSPANTPFAAGGPGLFGN